MSTIKIKRRERRKVRIRSKIKGAKARPRVSVFRSNQSLYVQLIDDDNGRTLIGKSDRELKNQEKNKVNRAKMLGKLFSEEIKKLGLTKVVFDRSGFSYHGRVKAVAEGIREGGIRF